MTMIPIAGLQFNGCPCSYDDGTVEPSPPKPPDPTPPGMIVYPPELVPKQKNISIMPWTNATRLSGPTITQTTAWIVKFRAGAAQKNPVRLQAIQREGGPIERVGILFRQSDGKVLQRLVTSSLTWLCLVGQPPDRYKVPLDANTDYAVGIFNVPPEQGAMFCDLYL